MTAEGTRTSLRQRLSRRLSARRVTPNPGLPPRRRNNGSASGRNRLLGTEPPQLPPLPPRKPSKHVPSAGSNQAELKVEENESTSGSSSIRSSINNRLKSQKDQFTATKNRIGESMGLMFADLAPKCAKCGGELSKGQNINICGMQKFHIVCPDKSELDARQRSVRNAVKSIPDRPVASVTVDEGGNAKPYTFLFQVDKKSKKAALKQKGAQPAVVTLRPDDKASLSRTRSLRPDHSDAEFGLSFRKSGKIEQGWSSTDPAGDVFSARPNLAMCGPAILNGEKVDIGLSHDGLLLVQKPNMARNHFNSVARDSVVMYALSAEHTDLMAVTRGIDLRGVFKGDCCSEDSSETEVLQLRTKYTFQALAWRNAFYKVLVQLGRGSDIPVHCHRVTIRSYNLNGGVLEQAVATVLYCKKDLTIEIEEEAHIIYSQFPESEDGEPQGDSFREIQSSIARAKEQRRKRLESETKSEDSDLD